MSGERTFHRTEFESRAERLGSALHQLAGDLVAERRKVAALRREIAELSSPRGSPRAADERADGPTRASAAIGGAPPGQRERNGRVAGNGRVRNVRSYDAPVRLAIAPDIHDGVQHRLTALRIRLSMAAKTFSGSGDPEAGAAFATFGDQVAEVIDELRAIARGIRPPLLASGGLSAALAAAGGRASAPVSVIATGTGRYSSEVELAVYLTALAAIDNAERHAGPGRVTVALSETGERLSFSISDEGPGFDPARVAAGGGIANMRARLAALGGSLEVESHPSQGTRIVGTVPLAPAAA
jgi:signal transduction histidine kinase